MRVHVTTLKLQICLSSCALIVNVECNSKTLFALHCTTVLFYFTRSLQRSLTRNVHCTTVICNYNATALIAGPSAL